MYGMFAKTQSHFSNIHLWDRIRGFVSNFKTHIVSSSIILLTYFFSRVPMDLHLLLATQRTCNPSDNPFKKAINRLSHL